MILRTEVVMATSRKEDEGVATYFPLNLTNTFKCQSDKVQAEDNSAEYQFLFLLAIKTLKTQTLACSPLLLSPLAGWGRIREGRREMQGTYSPGSPCKALFSVTKAPTG